MFEKCIFELVAWSRYYVASPRLRVGLGDGTFPVLKGSEGKGGAGRGQRRHSAMGPTGLGHLVGYRASGFGGVGRTVGREIKSELAAPGIPSGRCSPLTLHSRATHPGLCY